MKIYQRILGVLLIPSFVFFSLPAFGDEQAMNAETMYSSIIDKEIAKYQAKFESRNSGGINLQQEAADVGTMWTFLKDNKKELIAEMKRKHIGTEDYQINNFLNEKFLEVSSSAWLQYCCSSSNRE